MRNALMIICVVGLLATLTVAEAEVTLRYGFRAGETLVYDCSSTGQGLIQAMGRTDPLLTQANFLYTVSCTGVGQDGSMTLVHEIQEPQITASWGGQPIPANVNIPTVVTVIEPGGRVLSTEVQRAAAADVTDDLGATMPGTGFDVGQFFGELRGPSFPVEAVGIGSTWQDALTLTTQSGQSMVISYVTTLLDFANLSGRPCARLQTDYDLPLDLSLFGGQLFNATGTHAGTQISYFDYQAGRLMRYDGTSDTEMTMATPQLFGGAGNQTSVHMTLRSVTAVVLRQ